MRILIKVFEVFLTVLFICTNLFSQSFEKSVLIDIPGDNYDFVLPVCTTPFPEPGSFITWINKNDSVYTVYLKRISPEISDSNIIISSDTRIKSNSRMSVDPDNPGIKIVWQEFSNNYYQIVARTFYDDSLSAKIIIEDFLTSDPMISVNAHTIVWIMDNKLYMKNFYPPMDPMLIDGSNCTSPDILDSFDYSTQIVYERIIDGNHQIYMLSIPDWTYQMISDGDNRNPNFGVYSGISFEKIEDGIHKIKYSPFTFLPTFDITENTTCNYKNPFVFSYDIPTSPLEGTPYFVVFDTDSIPDNNEVFIKTFYWSSYDSLINISGMEGDDFKPKAGYIGDYDSIFVIIVWLHRSNSKTDIWMAKERYDPLYGTVKEENLNISSFDLLQNYPNPFNPVTNIGYFIKEGANVEIKVFDILGNDITTLVNEYKSSGKHKVIFDANNLSSGIYFYTINVNGIQKTKSMVLLK